MKLMSAAGAVPAGQRLAAAAVVKVRNILGSVVVTAQSVTGPKCCFAILYSSMKWRFHFWHCHK